MYRFITNTTMCLQVLKSYSHCAALAALVCGLLITSCSQEPAHEGVRLAVKPEKADFGAIESNNPVAFHDATVTLANRGKERLDIKDVELPEGFSYIIVPRKSIGPGEKATLKITIDRRKFSGQVTETAYVLSNDSARPKIPIALAASIVGDSSAPVAGGASGPDISFDHKAHNFGTLTRSQMLEHSFPFKNVGDKTLKIHYIETTCLCATATASRDEIPPGESAEIIAKLEAYKFPGDKTMKTLTVATNDPDEPAVGLTIMAMIIDAARIEPEEILLPNVQTGQPAWAEARLIQDGAEDLIIKRIESSSPMISVDSSPLEGEQKGYLLKIAVNPKMPEGKFEELVTIFTNYTNYTNKKKTRGPGLKLYKNYKKLRLSVKGSVKGPISVTPQSVNFGSAAPGESLQRKLTISGVAPFEIRSVSLADTAFRASFAPVDSGDKYVVTLEFLPDQTERQIEDKLVITTADKELTVPVFATVKSDS